MDARPQVAVFGEALVDVTRTAEEVRVRPGGSPLNVAVGLARLGADVELATIVGDDAHGSLVIDHLARAGVTLTPGSIVTGPTSVAEAEIGKDGGASYRFSLDWSPEVSPVRPAQAAHIGSISAVLEPGAQAVLRWARSVRPASVVSFDPNIRPSITGLGDDLHLAVAAAAALADIVKVSAEDLELLGGADDLPRKWLDGGAKVVVVTEGALGARVLAPGGERHLTIPRVRVVDTIGAGDSFMAGLIWSLGVAGLLDRRALSGARIDDLVAHAAFAAGCAAITVGRDGADPPTRDDLRELQVPAGG